MHGHMSVNYFKMLCIQRHKWITKLTEITFLTALDNWLLNRHLCVFCVGFELLYIIWVNFGLSPSKTLQFPILSTAQDGVVLSLECIHDRPYGAPRPVACEELTLNLLTWKI